MDKLLVKDYPSYEDVINSFGVEVVAIECMGSYQGDYAVALRDSNKVGFLMFGYGSCSGCDSLAACDTDEELESLQSRLFESISWGDDFKKLVEDRAGWYTFDHEWVAVKKKLLKAMEVSR